MKKLLLAQFLLLFLIAGLHAQFTSTVTNVTCFGACNGSAVITNVGHYRYRWSNTDTLAINQQLCAGRYVCNVYDSVLHFLDSVVVVVVQPSPMALNAQTSPVHCGLSVGSVNVVVTGGSPPYNYFWSNGSAVPVITDLSTGVYSVTVADVNGCSASASATVNNDNSPFIITDSINTPSSCGTCNGRDILSLTGATYPVHYLWSTGDTIAAPFLCAGNNAVTVTDAYGCNSEHFVQIANTGGVSISGETNGFVNCTQTVDSDQVFFNGGSPPYTVVWGDGEVNTYTIGYATHGFNGTGNYNINVTDSSGCSYFYTDTVASNGIAPQITTISSPLCNNLTAGAIFANPVNGTPPYTYHWFNGSTNDTISNLAAGDYTITVTDNTGCTATAVYSLIQLNSEPGYYVYAQSTNSNCLSNGSVAVNITGGTAPFSYLWGSGQTSDSLSGLTAGGYPVTVTDANGCIAVGFGYVQSSCNNIISGTIFGDVNGNCVRDSGDLYISCTVSAIGNNGLTYYGYAGAYGFYSIVVPDSGTYTLSVSVLNSYVCAQPIYCGNSNHTVTFNGVGDTSANNNIGLDGTTGFDLTLHPGWTQANPGFTKEYWVMDFNQSPVQFTGTATITFTYDSNLIYQYSMAPLPTVDLVAHTLTWQDANVPSPGFNWNNRFRNFFTVPATLPVGYLLQSRFSITPTSGDCNTDNNVLTYSETCTGSHDPNEKTVSPEGALTEDDSVLTYTINFQNTGTAATNFIIVKDTLSPGLDASTVVNIASSYKYDFTVSGTGILTWTFNPYYLPDSISNPTGSKGFVMFTVKKKAGLQPGTNISNTAAVFFDYNEPVFTNTVTDSIARPSLVFDQRGNSDINVKAFPNPFNDFTDIVVTGVNQKFGFELYDVTGRLQQSLPSVNNNRFRINRNGLANGVYLYRIVVNNQQAAYGKVVVE